MEKPKVKRVRVRTLVPSDDLPPAKEVQKFITNYCNTGDAKLSACLAGLDPSMGARLYKEPSVRSRIDAKMLLVDMEEAKLKAQARALTTPMLDVALVEEVRNKKRSGTERVKAIELGYRRTGMIRDGEFYIAPDPTTTRNGPSIYQSRTVKRVVTEEVSQTQTVVVPETPSIFAVREY